MGNRAYLQNVVVAFLNLKKKGKSKKEGKKGRERGEKRDEVRERWRDLKPASALCLVPAPYLWPLSDLGTHT